MILVTGGAGFIGSNLVAALVARGERVAVADWLGDTGKWRNLGKHPPETVLAPDALDGWFGSWLDSGPPLGAEALAAVVHLGAISETTATDGDLVWQTNVELSWRLWRWCAAQGVPFLYASSAATYGAGEAGFDDAPERLAGLRPLNLYGWTKHAFDLRVAASVARGEKAPPRWAGLKFFNVYGPNEYHKGAMISVVKRKFDERLADDAARLFASDVPGLPDGHQARDFIWVGDVVDVLLWLLDAPALPSGLYNLGTGRARTYLDLAFAVCDAMGVERRVEFVPMPEPLRGQYQSFTEARMDRLREAGYPGKFTPLEDGVRRYVQDYLAQPDSYA
jgi:ADP-L-glycero-D-manno-heptose 6-epimerase